MRTVVFGRGVEPEGMDLDDDLFEADCPECSNERARYRIWESAESCAITQHCTIYCPVCGYTLSDNEEL